MMYQIILFRFVCTVKAVKLVETNLMFLFIENMENAVHTLSDKYTYNCSAHK